MFRIKAAEKIKTRVLCSITLENHPIFELMLKNIVEPDRPQMTMWRMRIACWIPLATNTYSECVILITFPQQQWLHERASMLRCAYIFCF